MIVNIFRHLIIEMTCEIGITENRRLVSRRLHLCMLLNADQSICGRHEFELSGPSCVEVTGEDVRSFAHLKVGIHLL